MIVLNWIFFKRDNKMAYSESQWEKAREYFEAGLSLTEISDRIGISKPQISKKSKAELWEKGNEKKHLVSQAVEVAIGKEKLKETALIVHDELVNEQIRRQGLVFGATEKLIKRANRMLDSNQTIEKVSVGDGVQSFEPRELNTTDLKNLSDTIDKASVTLNVNPRHSTQQINVNTQNNQVQVKEFSEFYDEK
jgi:predicted DNA-binding protein YlxM (UPF0122 family)